MGPLPLAVLLVGAGIAAGPLLLADESYVVGRDRASPSGSSSRACSARSLHTLSRRWAILVPAGLVIVDPMTLADPVLFTLEDTEAARARAPGPAARARGGRPAARRRAHLGRDRGARAGPDRPGALEPAGRPARDHPRALFAPVRPHELLEHAAERRLPVVGSRGDADRGCRSRPRRRAQAATTALPTTRGPSYERDELARARPGAAAR